MLIDIADQGIQKMTPINHERFYPPFREMARFTFLSSEGLYVGQGSIDYMQKESFSKPLLSISSELLVAAADLS